MCIRDSIRENLISPSYTKLTETLDEIHDIIQGTQADQNTPDFYSLEDKILIDATVPLVPPKVMRVQLPPEGSAAMKAQSIMGEGTKVVSAFQNISAELLQTDKEIDCDVLVSGDFLEARATVIELAADAGLKGWHAGPLCNSVAAEALTSILIAINKKHSLQHSGIKITGH